MYNPIVNKKIRRCFAPGFLIALLLLPQASFAGNNSVLEYKIKAGYLYNFTKFISWPENQSTSFNICIIGKDPFGAIIDPIEKRKVDDKPIKLYRFQTVNQVELCQIAYFADPALFQGVSDLASLGILAVSSFKDTLMVSESKPFVLKGGMIAFAIKEGKVKLYINLDQVKKSGLVVSAKLLEVATIIREGDDD